MGPVRQNPIQRTVRSVQLCTIVAHKLHRITDLIIFPLALQTITIAPMMSIWGKWGSILWELLLLGVLYTFFIYLFTCLVNKCYIFRLRTSYRDDNAVVVERQLVGLPAACPAGPRAPAGPARPVAPRRPVGPTGPYHNQYNTINQSINQPIDQSINQKPIDLSTWYICLVSAQNSHTVYTSHLTHQKILFLY